MRFAAFYIPDFSVWALYRSEPRLRGRELLVHAAGKVIARSERLRQQGIQPGWAIERAQAQAPEALVRPYPGTLVRVAWEMALQELNQITPWIEPIRPGLAMAQFFHDHDATLAAAQMQARLGVADDRPTARLAAWSASLGQASIIASGQGKAFRDRLPITYLREADVSLESLQRLFWLGFKTVGAVARLSAAQLAAQFPEGEALSAYARGQGQEAVAVYLPPPALSARYRANEPLREPHEYEPILQHLLRRLHGLLGERLAQLVTVSLDGKSTARRVAHEATDKLRELLTLGRLALREAQGGEDMECITVMLGGLCRARPLQERLWAERDEVQKAVAALELRCPGSALRLVAKDENAYLPEEAYQLVSAVKSAQPDVKPAPKPKKRPSLAGKRRRPKLSNGGTIRHDGSVASNSLELYETFTGAH